MRFIVLIALIGMLFSMPVQAAEQCYSVNELKAEQLLRLHSELMVITVTCHQGSRGENLVPAYTGFTKENIKQLHAAEKVMMHYYAAIYGGNGVEQLDKLRTKLGNEYGQKIADISAPLYCHQYRDKVLQFNSCTPGQLDDEVEHMVSSERSYGQPCVAK